MLLRILCGSHSFVVAWAQRTNTPKETCVHIHAKLLHFIVKLAKLANVVKVGCGTSTSLFYECVNKCVVCRNVNGIVDRAAT